MARTGASRQGSGSNRVVRADNSSMPQGSFTIKPGSSGGNYWAEKIKEAMQENPEFYKNNPGSAITAQAMVDRLNGDITHEEYKQQQNVGLGTSLAKKGTAAGKQLGQNLIDLGKGNISQEEFNVRKKIQDGQYIASGGTDAGKAISASIIGQATGELTAGEAQKMRNDQVLGAYGMLTAEQQASKTAPSDALLDLTTGAITQDEYNTKRAQFGELGDTTISGRPIDELNLSRSSGDNLPVGQVVPRLITDDTSQQPLQEDQVGPTQTTADKLTRVVIQSLRSVEQQTLVGFQEAKQTSIISNVPTTSYFSAALGKFVNRQANGSTTYEL